MLEEALSDPKYYPSEAAYLMLNFVQDLPSGGAIAEKRFFRLFSLLCDRVFGPIDMNDEYYRHQSGGWLSAQVRWSDQRQQRSSSSSITQGRLQTSTSSGSKSINNSSRSVSLDNENVVRLLGTATGSSSNSIEGGVQISLMEAISQEVEHRPGVLYPFPFAALPKLTQEKWLAVLETQISVAMPMPLGGGAANGGNNQVHHHNMALPNDADCATDNALRLYGSLLRVKPEEQHQLRRYRNDRMLRYHNVLSSPTNAMNNNSVMASHYTTTTNHLHTQQQHQYRSQVQQPLWLSSSGMASPTGTRGNMMSSPNNNMNMSVTPTSNDKNNANNTANNNNVPDHFQPQVFFTVLEYYLFLFIRYPLAMPKKIPQQPTPQGVGIYYDSNGIRRVRGSSINSTTVNGSGRYIETFGDKIYFHLFCRYLKHFISSSSSRISIGGGLMHNSSNNYNNMRNVAAILESEFFLRVVIDLWLESHVQIPKTIDAVNHIQQVNGRYNTNNNNNNNNLGNSNVNNNNMSFHTNNIYPQSSSPFNNNNNNINNNDIPNVDLNMSYDLAQGKFIPPPYQVQTCLRHLIIHIVKDASIYDSVMDYKDLTIPNNRYWCLSQPMTDIQQPFYNYIRSTLRHASIHDNNTDGNGGSPFFTALDSWLIWLEPWNVTTANVRNFSPKNATKRIFDSVSGVGAATKPRRATRTLKIPSPNDVSKYDETWEPYIAANIHLYTVPLAIFLRRARELDFSSKQFRKSMWVVQRVFRVYTKQVVESISKLLMDPNMSVSRNGIMPDARLIELVSKHNKNLGAYGPTVGGNTDMGRVGGIGCHRLSLSSCQVDVSSLLEEIYVQHEKTVRDLSFFDRVEAYFEGIFGQDMITRDQKALNILVQRAKVIVQLPSNYEISSSSAPTAAGGTEMFSSASGQFGGPTRNIDGTLTDEGREQILRGYAKCTSMDVSFMGDRMYSRVGSHEIPFLVTLTIRISNYLNHKLGLCSSPGQNFPPDDKSKRSFRIFSSFRFNLRFLADYRNIFFLSFIYWLLKMFMKF